MRVCRYKRNTLAFICIAGLLWLGTAGIACSRKPAAEHIVVRINDYTLTMQEFNELYARQVAAGEGHKSRKEFLDRLIIRKLILQEAVRQGLDKEKEFLDAIERFWEQSLLRVAIGRENDILDRTIRVSDAEIRDAYTKWIEQNPEADKSRAEMERLIRRQLFRVKHSLAFNTWVTKLKNNADITVDRKAIGVE